MAFFTQPMSGDAFSTTPSLVLVTTRVFVGNYPVVCEGRNVRFLMWE